MCMTSAPAKLSGTLIYSGEGVRNDKKVHVLAYQNVATNQSSGPNAMILPFPTRVEMTEDNIIDTRTFKSFLKDITNASKMRTRSLGFDRREATKGIAFNSAKVFDVGSYTVVLAKEAWQIPEALTRVPEHKRPTISTKFLEGFSKLYKDQPIAVCCFDGTIEAEPLLWWYEPKLDGVLFIPTMDAHDGGPPKLSEVVQTDHIISVGSSENSRVGHHYPVFYKEALPDNVRGLLPSYVYGTKLKSTYKNGDMFVDPNNMGTASKTYKDVPKAIRGANMLEAATTGLQFEMFGWG